MRRCEPATLGAGVCLLLFFFLADRAESMTVKELVQELKKVGADEAALLEAFPSTIEESRPDFLGGAAYLKVVIRDPHHPHVLGFVVPPGKGVYRLALGVEELERMRTELKLAIKDADMALRWVQWRLAQTEGGAFWPVSSVDQVPFLSARPGDAAAAERIAKARAALAPLITPPAARVEKDGFVATQIAVKGRDLVRYEVRIARDASWSGAPEILASDIPVVYVGED